MPIIAGSPEPTLIDEIWAEAGDMPASRPRKMSQADIAAMDRDVGDRIGIIFVHGVGSQPAGETLFDWAAPIIRTLWRWSEQQGDGSSFRDPVEIAQVDLTGATTPLLQVRVPAVPGDGGMAGHKPQLWIMSEAWWAADVKPAGIDDMVRWGRRHLPQIVRGIGIGILRSLARRGTDPTQPDIPGNIERRQRLINWFDKVTLWGLFGSAAGVAAVVYGFVRIVKTLPIPAAKDLNTQPLDWFLSEWFGDIRILLRDRAQAANLRMRLATTIEKVNAYGAERIILIAHSGGTVLSYMLLADEAHAGLGVSKLITHGQAIGLAWRVGLPDGPGQPVPPDYDEGLRTGDRLLMGTHRPPDKPDEWRPRWVDFHATHDIAPAFSADGWPSPQPPDELRDGPDESWTVANRMSVVNDHGGYWDNEEEFVIPVLRELDTPDGTWRESRFYPAGSPDSRKRVLRRESRVRSLSRWWIAWMVSSAVTLTVALLATQPADRGLDRLAEVLGPVVAVIPIVGFAAGAEPWVLGLLIVAVLLFAISSIGVSFWNRLDGRERAEARNLAVGDVERHPTRGGMLLLLFAVVPTLAMAIAPTWPLDALGWKIPAGWLELPFRLLALAPTVIVIALAFVTPFSRLIGRLLGWLGWLPEVDVDPGPAIPPTAGEPAG